MSPTTQYRGQIQSGLAVQMQVNAQVDISGDPVNISGQPVSVSGNIVSANVSGNWVEAHVMSGVVTASGDWVEAHILSGFVTVSGSVTILSGIVNSQNPTQGRSRGTLMVSSASGGVLLSSGDCISVTIRMLVKGSGGQVPQSGIILVGFDAIGERPYASSSGIAGYNSGWGFSLTAGDAVTYNMDNMNRVRVYALLSGEMISYTASQF